MAFAPPRQAAAVLKTAADFESAARALTKPPELQALGTILGQLVLARLEPLPERQVLSSIKAATGIPVAVLEKQIGELRRRLNSTGDIHRQPARPRWASQLRLDLAGTPERNEANVITALSNDEAFAGALVFDDFRQEILVTRKLPWDELRCGSAASLERCRRCALCRVAATARDQCRTGHGQSQRRRSRARGASASGPRLS